MTELAERFSGALHNTSRAWRQALDRRLKYLGVSQASWMTIAVAAKARQPLSQSELAESLGVEAATFRKELRANVDPKKLLAATELLEGLEGTIEAAP